MEETVGKRIRRLRKQAGLTQEELAQKVGLQKSAIAKYENGKVTNIKKETIEQMAEVLGVGPSYLQWGDDAFKALTKERVELNKVYEHEIRILEDSDDLTQKDYYDMLEKLSDEKYASVIKNVLKLSPKDVALANDMLERLNEDEEGSKEGVKKKKKIIVIKPNGGSTQA